VNEKYKHLMKRLRRTVVFNNLDLVEVEGMWAFKVPNEEGVKHNIYASDDTNYYTISLTVSPKEGSNANV